MRKICAIVNGDFFYYNRQEKLTPDPDLILTPHAPVSCLTEARGKDIVGGTAYMTEMCCPECMKALGAARIKKVVFREDRQEPDADTARKVAEYFDIELVKNEYLGL